MSSPLPTQFLQRGKAKPFQRRRVTTKAVVREQTVTGIKMLSAGVSSGLLGRLDASLAGFFPQRSEGRWGRHRGVLHCSSLSKPGGKVLVPVE